MAIQLWRSEKLDRTPFHRHQASCKNLPINKLSFQRAKKALSNSIIVECAFPTHTLSDIILHHSDGKEGFVVRFSSSNTR